MKKILAGLIAFLLITGATTYSWYKISYAGTSCYVQINNDGKKTIEKGHENNVWHGFSYKEKVHEKSGKEKVLEFTSTHNLRKQAYLKLTYNKGKGVTNWEEIKKSEVPKKALDNF